jgi:hypothetical protein
MYLSKDGSEEYFDSLGEQPRAIFRDYLEGHCRNFVFNEEQLQSVLTRFVDIIAYSIDCLRC